LPSPAWQSRTWRAHRPARPTRPIALYALWPFIPGLVVGSGANGNGQWDVETGLHLYTEPLSTALVITAVALILRTPPTDLSLAIAGLSLGYASAVKITDATIAVALFVVLLAFRRFRAAGLLAAGGLVFLVPIAAFWNKGYVEYYNGGVSVNPHPFGFRYVSAAWTDSILLTPTMLTLLLVPAIVGLATLSRRFAQAVIGVPIVVTAVLYAFTSAPLIPVSSTSCSRSCSRSTPRQSSGSGQSRNASPASS
jgi:hypothetical protein